MQPLSVGLAVDTEVRNGQAATLCASLPLPDATHLKAITVLPMIRMFRQDVRQQLNWVWREK